MRLQKTAFFDLVRKIQENPIEKIKEMFLTLIVYFFTFESNIMAIADSYKKHPFISLRKQKLILFVNKQVGGIRNAFRSVYV